MKFGLNLIKYLATVVLAVIVSGCDSDRSFDDAKSTGKVTNKTDKALGQKSDAEFGNETNFPISDTGLWAEFRNKNLFWINDEALVFNGFETGKYVHYDSKDPNKPETIPMVWDIKKRNFYPLLQNTSSKLKIKCKIKNQFYYLYSTRGKNYEFYFGNIDFTNDRYFLNSTRKKTEEDEITSQSRGFCNIAPKGKLLSKTNPTTYLSEIDGEIQHYPYADRAFFSTIQHPEKLILPTRLIDFSTLYYSEYLGVYQYTSRKTTAKTPVLGKILPFLKENGEPYLEANYNNTLLYPDGSIKILEFPADDAGKTVEVFKVEWTNVGPVFQTSIEDKDGNDVRGLYLLSDKHYKLILRGIIGNTRISPSGCRLAVDHFPKTGQSGWRKDNLQTLKIVDFCN